MKKWVTALCMALVLAAGLFAANIPAEAQAKPDDTILKGVFAGSIDLSGMTRDQAAVAVQTYVDSLSASVITLDGGDGHTVNVTAGDMGMGWSNTGLVEEAVNLGKSGNVVVRYKALKDLEHSNKVYDIEFSFDKEAIVSTVESRCSEFNVEALDAHLSREGGVFAIKDGQTGYEVDSSASTDVIYTYLTSEWKGQDSLVSLVVSVTQPKGNKEELAKVKDVLGTYTTSFTNSGKDRSANVNNGCNLINGYTLYSGETFSTYDAVSPFTADNGYYMAGSYLNGQVVDSIGGGICQVSTTLYNAVLKAELQVDERHNHSMIVSYVKPSMDAAIAESSGKDFTFINNTPYPVYIEGNVSNKNLTFTIYGVETRDSGRVLSYESEVLETIRPDAEKIIQSTAQPIGYVDVQSAHIGYKARLWKVVTQNGVEVSREQVNSSNYKMTPRTATVGVSTDNAEAYNHLQAAIASGSIDQVKSVASALKSGQFTPPVTTPGVDPALAAILQGKTPEEQAALIQQYNEQLAKQQMGQ